jgi:hypothetical protein
MGVVLGALPFALCRRLRNARASAMKGERVVVVSEVEKECRLSASLAAVASRR